MRIIFLTLIVWFIAPNSFANENIDKINSFGKKIDKSIKLFNSKWDLYEGKFKIISLGQKEVDLYFADVEEEIDYIYECGTSKTIDISKLVDTKVIVQNLTKMETYERNADVKYSLYGTYKGITIDKKGVISFNNFQ